MKHSLRLTPTGRILIRENDEGETPVLDAWMGRVIDAFSSGKAAGIFAMAASRVDAPPPPSFAFWRDFACRYLTELCRTSVTAGVHMDSLPPPSPEETEALLHGALPPEADVLD